MGEFWGIEREVGNVAIITLNRTDKEVNTLSEKVVRELSGILDGLASDPAIEGLVIASGKKDFVIGADIDRVVLVHRPYVGVERDVARAHRTLESFGELIHAADWMKHRGHRRSLARRNGAHPAA